MANDMPFADIVRTKFEQGLEMAGIGYYYTLEELGVAMQIPNMNLTAERGDAARRAYEEFMERIAFTGDVDQGLDRADQRRDRSPQAAHRRPAPARRRCGRPRPAIRWRSTSTRF